MAIPAMVALTPRQVEVVCLAAQGCTDKQIAAILGLAVGTVRGYLRGACERLGARTRTEAVLALRKLARASAPPGSEPG